MNGSFLINQVRSHVCFLIPLKSQQKFLFFRLHHLEYKFMLASLVRLHLVVLKIWACPRSCPQLFCKKRALKNFAKFTGKDLCWVFFERESCRPHACNFIKRESPTRMLSSELCEIFKNNFCYRISITLLSPMTRGEEFFFRWDYFTRTQFIIIPLLPIVR